MLKRALLSLVTCVSMTDPALAGTALEGVGEITVPFMTSYEDAMSKLPKTMTISSSSGSPLSVEMEWKLDQPYFPYTFGNYTAIGTPKITTPVSEDGSGVSIEVKTRLRVESGRGLMKLGWEGFNQPGKYVEGTLTLEGTERTYYYYVPTSYDGSKAVPLLFDLHGGGSNGLAQWSSSRSDRLAEREGIIVVAPNDHSTEFDAAILDKMEKEFKIDTKRVYAMGVSMGGMGASNLCLELSHRIAAISVISGHFLLSRHAQSGADLPRPMPVVLFAGTKESTSGAPFRNFALSMIQTGQWLAKQNGCDSKPDVTVLTSSPEALDLDDLPLWTTKADALTLQQHYPTSVVKYEWSGGKNGHEIIAYAVEGGGHCWPGGNQFVVETTVGPVTHMIDATQSTWEHLKRFTLPQ